MRTAESMFQATFPVPTVPSLKRKSPTEQYDQDTKRIQGVTSSEAHIPGPRIIQPRLSSNGLPASPATREAPPIRKRGRPSKADREQRDRENQLRALLPHPSVYP